MASSTKHLSRKQLKPVPDSASVSEEHVDAGLEGRDANQLVKLRGPGDFVKIRLLGRGAVGRVYLVQQKETGRLYAMKVLSKQEMISKNKVQRVFTERQVLATTRHPLIVSLYYSFQTQSKIYFVMAYCAGGEFYRTIKMQPNQCLTEDQMRFYAAEVLLALEYLHFEGFVYRDLKPENVLMHESGHIRLADFDLAKKCVNAVDAHVVESIMGMPNVAVEPTLVTNSFVGTEEYLAPEVIVGRGYGSSVDWWSFGVLMYEMLYGITPFRGKSRQDTFDRIAKGHVKFPEHPHGQVSKECKSLIKKLLVCDPKRRLGYEHGAIEIKTHAFFVSINLQLIMNMTPPIIPTFNTTPSDLSGPADEESSEELVSVDDLSIDHPFKSFSSLDAVDPSFSSEVTAVSFKTIQRSHKRRHSHKPDSQPSSSTTLVTQSKNDDIPQPSRIKKSLAPLLPVETRIIDSPSQSKMLRSKNPRPDPEM